LLEELRPVLGRMLVPAPRRRASAAEVRDELTRVLLGVVGG